MHKMAWATCSQGHLAGMEEAPEIEEVRENVSPLRSWPIEASNIRQANILRSSKRGGDCMDDSQPYLRELGVEIVDNIQPIQFLSNASECVHRWAPYVQGFSSLFVQSIVDHFRNDYAHGLRVVDPFAGCGTVLIQSKMNGIESFGVELNPLLQFIADVKLNSWMVNPSHLIRTYESLPTNLLAMEPEFLKSGRQFNPGVLLSLKRIKGGIDSLIAKTQEQGTIKNVFLLAFSAIIIDCSNLKRTPCLGYWKNKAVADDVPFQLFRDKVFQIADDLRLLQKRYQEQLKTKSTVVCANSKSIDYPHKFDLAITSPPYMSGMDYVMNYKIEMAWLGFVGNHKEAKAIKDSMVVCDNVSKGLIRDFANSRHYSNDWINNISNNIATNLEQRGSYRRLDMPWIVQKYFDDMYQIIRHVSVSLATGGRFILVVGDSLIADTYVPTDLIIARIGQELGLAIEKIELARTRRSGQIRDYRLRETVITLRK